MARVVVTGIAGRMGLRLAALTIEGDGLELVGGVEAPGHEAIGSPVSELVGQFTEATPAHGCLTVAQG